jgi:hypothetical protein
MFTRTSLCAAALAASVLAASVGLPGCASLRGRTEGPTVPIAVEVQNNLALPTDLTIYAVTRSGARTLLGDVPPASTKSFTFKPVSFSEPYRLLATRPLHRTIASQVFTVGSDMTGRIIWTMSPNIVGFEEVDTDSTAAPDTAKKP